LLESGNSFRSGLFTPTPSTMPPRVGLCHPEWGAKKPPKFSDGHPDARSAPLATRRVCMSSRPKWIASPEPTLQGHWGNHDYPTRAMLAAPSVCLLPRPTPSSTTPPFSVRLLPSHSLQVRVLHLLLTFHRPCQTQKNHTGWLPSTPSTIFSSSSSCLAQHNRFHPRTIATERAQNTSL